MQKMIKYDISGDGILVDVSYEYFLILLTQFVNISFSLAQGYIINQASGLADFNNEYFKATEAQIMKQYLIIRQVVNDKKLSEQLDKFIELINELSKTDEQIITAYHDVIMQTKRTKKPIKDLKKEVKNFLYKNHFSPPIIVKQFAKETSTLVPKLEQINNHAHERIKQLILLENKKR